MPRFFRARAIALVVTAALYAACSRDEPEAPAGDAPDTADATSVAAPADTALPLDTAGIARTSDAAVVVAYEHVRTCSRFMGREGQFFAYRITSVRNGGSAPFTLEPAMMRFTVGDSAAAAPVFSVPEFSDLEVAPGVTEPSTEQFLLERSGSGAPSRGAVPLGYASPDVSMVRGTAEPEYDDGTGCDEFNT